MDAAAAPAVRRAAGVTRPSRGPALAAADVVIPVKALRHAKHRLAPVLDPAQRAALMLALLDVAVAAVGGAARVRATHVATSDAVVAGAAARLGVAVLDDQRLEWNAGLSVAAAAITPRPETIVFLACDLPFVSAGDVEALISAIPARGVAVARARDGGTNALGLRPPGVITPRFGAAHSARVHVAAAAAAGAATVVIDRPGLAHDVDTPADLTDAVRDATGPPRPDWVDVVESARGGRSAAALGL